MGRIIQCPNIYHPTPELEKTIFLAGGITNCPDWQSPLAMSIAEKTDFAIFNPRREKFPMDDPGFKDNPAYNIIKDD